MPKTLKRPAKKTRWKPAAGDKPMDTGLQVPFDIVQLPEVSGAPCPCGTSRRAFIRKDNQVCSVHLVEIKQDSQTHYHKGFTQTYYFLEGEGQTELNGKLYPAKPGMTLMSR